jgi:hypothetical protein
MDAWIIGHASLMASGCVQVWSCMEMAGVFLVVCVELLVLGGVYCFVGPRGRSLHTRRRRPERLRSPSIVPDEVPWRS